MSKRTGLDKTFAKDAPPKLSAAKAPEASKVWKDLAIPAVDDRKLVAYRLSRDAARQLKMMAVEQDKTLQDVLEEATEDLFRKHGKPVIL